MKKVLSVLLAAAMVMGMSVTSFAAENKVWGSNLTGEVDKPVNEVIWFHDKVIVERNEIDGYNKDYMYFDDSEELFLEPGDNLYFPLLTAGTREVLDCTYTHEHDDGCYEWKCTSALEENNHVHVEECYKPTKELTCNEHTEHTGECYKEVKEEICGGLHEAHDFVECGGCLNKSHKHNHGAMEGKYFETGSCIPACGKEIHKEHDEKECYKITNELICEKELHVHDDVKCYTVDNGEPICGKVNHVCTDDKKDCTLMKGNLICGLDKEKDHEHGKDCYKVVGTNVNYTGEIDTDWSINIEGNKYVANASYYTVPTKGVNKGIASWGQHRTPGEKYVKVEIVDDLDEVVDKTVKFDLYIADGDHRNVTTEHVIVEANLSNVDKTINKVDFNHTNDVDVASTWAVAKNAKGTATFDFDDNVFFTVKMVSEEKVTLNLSVAYDKAVDKLFDYDADLSFYNFKGSKDAFTKTGELFIPADEDTFIYEVVDGKLVEVEATWTDEYTITDVTKEYEGWVIETKELGYYVVSDIEAEIEVEAEEEVEAPVVEADKANPETGAADFVGAAVAMAVVSVAAAGALALKK